MSFREWLKFQETGDLNAYGVDDQDQGKLSVYRPPKGRKSKKTRKVDKLFKGEADENEDVESRGAGCLFTDGNSILLLLRSTIGKNPDTWGLPAGHAKQGESPLETANRECKEEIGVDPNDVGATRIASFPERQGRWTIFMYRVERPFKCTLNQEHTQYEWVPIDDLFQRNLHPIFARNASVYLRKIRQ